ncbi:hypothetical protein ACFFWD_10885 [Bradyrhizobium erythrophlei]|uniref:hypothetical protein n=1 Tax=Bradyrhizobium erythrophlei TaxID=1437360 RepID=UPI0035EA8A05
MPNYTIVRIGNEYIVRADEKSILRTSSRRMAAKMVTEAVELLDQEAAQRIEDAPSISRDADIAQDASKVP